MCHRVVSLPLDKPQRSVPQGNRWSRHASLSRPNTIGPRNSCASERRGSRTRSVLSGLIFRWPWFATDPHQNSCFRYLHRPARTPPGLPMGGGGQSKRGRPTPLQVLLAAALRPHRTYCGASRIGCRHATLNVRNGSVAALRSPTHGGPCQASCEPRAQAASHRVASVSAPTSRCKKARRGGYTATGFLSLFDERTFPPRNAFEPLLRRNAALPECVRKTTFTVSSQ